MCYDSFDVLQFHRHQHVRSKSVEAKKKTEIEKENREIRKHWQEAKLRENRIIL